MRRSIAALGVFAAVTVLAACNNGTTSSPSSSSSATTGIAATLMIWAGDTRFTQVEALVGNFTTNTDVKINIVQKSESDMDTEFTTQVPTDNGLDLIVMAHDKLGTLVASGVISPVDLGEAKSSFADVVIKTVTYNGQTYSVPYAIESVALVRNNTLTRGGSKTYGDMIASGRIASAEHPFIIQTGDKGDPYHFYGFRASFGTPVFNTNADGEYTSELTMGGPDGTDSTIWPRAQADVNVFSLSITTDIAKQAFLDGKTAYTVVGPQNVATFRGTSVDISVLPTSSTGSQVVQPSVGVQMFYQSAKSANPVVAKQFFNYLATPGAQGEMQKLDGCASAMPSVAAKLDDQDIKDFAKVAESGALAPAIPAVDFVWSFWGQTEADIVSSTETPTEDRVTMATNIDNAIASK